MPPEGVPDTEGDQDEEEDPGPEPRYLIVACQSSLMLNESRKFMTVEGAGQVLLAELTAALGEGLQARQLREEETSSDICKDC